MKFFDQCQRYLNMASTGNFEDTFYALLSLEQLLVKERTQKQIAELESKHVNNRVTATECNKTMNEVERNKFGFQIQTCVNKVITGRSACDRRAAFDELQTLMYREQWKIERAADEERREKTVITLGLVEDTLKLFVEHRNAPSRRDNESAIWETPNSLALKKERDEEFSDSFKDFFRRSLNFPRS